MDQRLFIAGSASALLRELIDLYLGKGYIIAVALEQGEEFPLEPGKEAGRTETGAEPAKKLPEKRIVRVPWNRRSPLSSQSAVLEAARAIQGIDKAIIIHSPGRENRAFHEATAGYIEEAVDFGVKGYLFLLRDVVGFLQKKGCGSLSLVMHDEGSEVLSPVEACVSGSFKALAQSLFMFYQNEPISITGFRSSSTQVPEYAQYIFRTLEEKQQKTVGQWLKYSDRSGFFQSLPLGLRKK